MKRKITYLLKDFDEMTKLILFHVKDIKSQAQLLKNKQEIFDEIDFNLSLIEVRKINIVIQKLDTNH